MDVRCSCFERHYQNWSNTGLAMEVKTPGTQTSATISLFGPVFTYWHSAGVNRLQIANSFQTAAAAGNTIDIDLSTIFASLSPFDAADFGRVVYGSGTIDGGDGLRGPMALVTLTIQSATTVRLSISAPSAGIGQFQVALGWASTVTRADC